MLGKCFRVASILLLSTASAALAQVAQSVPRLVMDINQQPWAIADPQPPAAGTFVQVGNRLVFSTSDAPADGGLWVTDGTPQGTAALPVAICPSPCQSISHLATLNGVALLRTDSGGGYVGTSVRLWRTDGTGPGTYPLTGPLSDLRDSLVASLAGAPALYFVGCRGGEGCELWHSNGTSEGTGILNDLRSGPESSSPHALTVWHGRLYFFADDGRGGRGMGLWSTDGTAAGAVFLAAARERDREELLTATPSRLFFTAGAFREELWTTDGQPSGTRRVRVFTGGPFPSSLKAFGDAVFFTARDEKRKEDQYWSSDGTEAGTRRWLVFSNPANTNEAPPVDATLHRVGPRWVLIAPDKGVGRLWTSPGDLGSASVLGSATVLTGCDGDCPTASAFVATESRTGGLLFAGSDPAHGLELWITDGTGPGTRRLTDVCPGSCSGLGGGVEPSPGASATGTYFVATPDPDNQRELWATDGTPQGTQRIGNLTADLGSWGGLAYFGTTSGTPPRGEVWATDGTATGTRQVAILGGAAPGSNPLLAPSPSGVTLLAWEGDSQFLWGSDGTAAGTHRLSDGITGDTAFADGFLQAGGLLFYDLVLLRRERVWGEELWRTDGTTSEGTRRAVELPPGRDLRLGTEWNGRLLFQMEGPAAGRCAWWVSDGTPTGTRQILPFPKDVQCATGVEAIGSKFLFVARTGAGRKFTPQLFVSDGTPGGTQQISRIPGPRDAMEPGFVRVGNTSFFLILNRKGFEAEVWRTDGTLAGTGRALRLPQPGQLFSFRGSLYLTAVVPGNPNGERALWRVDDGKPPLLLHTLRYGAAPSFTPLGNQLLFTAEADAHGSELWRTDGTPEGTVLVRDILPGEGSSTPTGLTAAGGHVYFAAHDGEHGWELWQSDGTSEGTRMVQDINPGPFSSAPAGFVVSGSNLFFVADDGETGRELWVLPFGAR
jgi:ELWxxDGT repeat protein